MGKIKSHAQRISYNITNWLCLLGVILIELSLSLFSRSVSSPNVFSLLVFSSSAYAADSKPDEGKKKDAKSLFDTQPSDEPTYINSDSMTLNSEKRVFNYDGNVVVKKGDLTLTSKQLEGKYGEDNKISNMIALGSVVITKPPNIRATGERAIYEANKDLVTLTENPLLYQGDSVLSADRVKVFLQENRSVAEGQVQMKVIKADEKKEVKTPIPSATKNKE